MREPWENGVTTNYQFGDVDAHAARGSFRPRTARRQAPTPRSIFIGLIGIRNNGELPWRGRGRQCHRRMRVMQLREAADISSGEVAEIRDHASKRQF